MYYQVTFLVISVSIGLQLTLRSLRAGNPDRSAMRNEALASTRDCVPLAGFISRMQIRRFRISEVKLQSTFAPRAEPLAAWTPPQTSASCKARAKLSSANAAARAAQHLRQRKDLPTTMILDSSGDEETLPLSSYSPHSPPPSPGFASRLQSSTRFLRGTRALLLAVLLTVYLALSHYNNSPRSAPLGYTTSGPQDGFEKAPEEPQLPILVLPNGTRYQHPLRPSWPDPWPHRPDVTQLLSSWRFPPPEDAIGVDADSIENVARRVLVGLGTKAPRRQFEVPEESLRNADSLFGRDAEEWKAAKLSKGEGYGKDGRPLQVQRDALYTGRNAGWKPPRLGSKKKLPQVQKESKDTRTEEHKTQDSQRREWVRKAFLHLWESE